MSKAFIMQLVRAGGLAKLDNPMSQKLVRLTSSCLDVKDGLSPVSCLSGN